jgi:hypothetical protein
MQVQLGELPIGAPFYMSDDPYGVRTGTVARKDGDRVVILTYGGMQTSRPQETLVKIEGSVTYPKLSQVLLLEVLELVEAEAVQDLEAARKAMTITADGGLKSVVHKVKERIMERLTSRLQQRF